MSIKLSEQREVAPDLPDARSQWALLQDELDAKFPSRCVRKVLLIAPPDADRSMFNFATAKRGRYWTFPPYGLGTIAAHLRTDKIAVQIVNLNHEVLKAAYYTDNEADFDFDESWQQALHQRMQDFEPDFVCITCMFSQTHNSAKYLVNELKRHWHDIPVAFGGVHVTNSFLNDVMRQHLLDDFSSVDFLFLYEAELAFKQFLRVVNRYENEEKVFQLYCNSEGSDLWFHEKLAVRGDDLDLVPAHDLMDTAELSRYGKVGAFYCFKNPEARFTTVLSNRGCRAKCTFCSVRNFNGYGVRHRSIDSVISELKILKRDFGIDHIMWLDDDLLRNEERAVELFKAMERENLGITWDCTNGVIAGSCKEEVISAAEASGCLGLTIGMESGNPEMLKVIKKPGTVKTFLKAAEVLRNHEAINARVFLMIGFPGETYRQIIDTINVAAEMNLDWYNITILQPLPNTPIYDSMMEQGLLGEVEFKDIRYNSGVYGKQRKKAEAKKDLLRSEFKNAFVEVDLDSVPPAEELDDIWAYMNYHLNFKRLFFETRPGKLAQQLKYVQNITDTVAPESAFAMYFCGYLQFRVNGQIDEKVISRLNECLGESEYWRNRFADFGLSAEHLRTLEFTEAIT